MLLLREVLGFAASEVAGLLDTTVASVEGPLRWRWRFLPARANGQLAFGTYRWDERRAGFVPAGLDLLALRGTRIAEVVSSLAQNAYPPMARGAARSGTRRAGVLGGRAPPRQPARLR